jgi:diaminopimelate decarboxylase
MAARPHERFQWDESGRAVFDGHDLAELATSYPTPFYLLSEGQIRDNLARFREAFSGVEDLRIYYSIKSNFESVTLRTLASEGCGAEISGALDLTLV